MSNEMRYLKIVDDRMSAFYGFKWAFLLFTIWFPTIAMTPVLIVLINEKLLTIGIIASLLLYVLLVVLWLRYRSNKKKKIRRDSQSVRITRKEYGLLNDYIERYSKIDSYASFGEIAKASERFELKDPLEPYEKYCFVRLNDDTAEVTSQLKMLVEKIFGLDKEENNVIWFAPKDRKPLMVTYFRNEDGELMKFRHGYRQGDFDAKSLELINDEVVLHIYGQ